ncbi:MAG: hypothetical protein IV100_04775 [Myxococcales bacterium]|nr:hypothetical protein [Myxococcales bacterium]
MLAELFSDYFHWNALDVAQKRHLNGYVVRTKVGLILIDPPSLPEPVLPALEALGKPKVVLLTGRAQERRAKQFRDWFGARILAPEGDQKLIRIPIDAYYKPGDTVPGGFRVHALPHQRTPGECVLYHPTQKVLIAGHLVGEPAGFIQLEDRSLYGSFSKTLEAQLQLLELDFERLLPGRGTPILHGGRIALAKYLAGFREGEVSGHW